MWKDQLILDVLWEDRRISFTTQTLDTFVPRSKMRQKTIVHLTVLNLTGQSETMKNQDFIHHKLV